MSKLECIVEFEQRFSMTPKQVVSLAEDIQIIQSLPVPTKEIIKFGGGQPKIKRIEVSTGDSGRPPFFYSVSYENDLYNKENMGSGVVHFSLHSKGYSSADLQKIKNWLKL